ncbi:FAD linked oxidase, C-terminal domain protein [Mycobacterium xenopi 3993]|nr:FAD linked oxidase, C-terminal domain protein [Mycobacterium xenopi 3993]
MKWNAWGDPAAAKPLSESIRSLLKQALGVQDSDVAELDADQVRLSSSALGQADYDALAAIVGPDFCRVGDRDRLLHAGGKSTLDLLRRKDTGVQEAPDAVLLPATRTTSRPSCDIARSAASPSSRSAAAPAWWVGSTRSAAGSTRWCRWICGGSTGCTRSTRCLAWPSSVPGSPALRPKACSASMGFRWAFSAELRVRHHRRLRGDPLVGSGFGGLRALRRHGSGLRVITPAGALELGRPGVGGRPDLRELMIGSEGVFGVITRVRLRVHRIPEATIYEAWSFPDFATGTAALRAVSQTGTGPTVIRLSDEAETGVNLATTEAIGQQQITGGCLAITVFEGTTAHAESRHAETRTLLEAHGGTSLGEEPAQAWQRGRFSAPYLRDSLLAAGALCETLETATDWSNITALKAAVTDALTGALAASGTPALVLCHISHVYPTGASLYFTVVAGQRGNPIEQWRVAKVAACDAIMRTGGTITHHHAVGADHRPWLRDEIGELGVQILRAVKSTLDPAGILNPAS